MTRKSIAFIISFFLDGGRETVLLQYLNYLVQLDTYDITLVIGEYTGQQEVFKKYLPNEVKIVYFAKSPILVWAKQSRRNRLPKPIKLFDELFINPIRRGLKTYRMAKLDRNNDVIIDFSHDQASFLKSVKAKKIVFFHSSISQEQQREPRVVAKMKKRIQVYDHIVTIAKDMYKEACTYYPNVKDRITMIYNTMDLEQIQRKAQMPVEDKRIEKPFLLSVSRLEEGSKDITSLIKAYAILRSKYGHDEELYIIGKGDALQQLQDEAVKQGVKNYVHFLGFMSNPYPWISQCQLFVQSSKYEGLPTTMIESLLLDKMIVATDCPTGPHEIINDGKAGILTPVGDVEALAKAMHEALTDKALQQRIAQGRAEHKKQFTWEVNGEKFRRLLDGDMPR